MNGRSIGLGIVAACCLTFLVFIRSSPTRDGASDPSARGEWLKSPFRRLTTTTATAAATKLASPPPQSPPRDVDPALADLVPVVIVPSLRRDTTAPEHSIRDVAPLRRRIHRTTPPAHPPVLPPRSPPSSPISPPSPPLSNSNTPPTPAPPAAPAGATACTGYMRCTNGTSCIVDSAGDPFCTTFKIADSQTSAYAAAYASEAESDVEVAVILKTHAWNRDIRREVDRMSVSFRAGVERWKRAKAASDQRPEIVPALHFFVLFDVTSGPPPRVHPQTREPLQPNTPASAGVPLASALPAVLITYTAADFPTNYETASGLKAGSGGVKYNGGWVTISRDPDTKYHANMVPLLFRRHPQLSRYHRMLFTVENDVKYTGDWHTLFVNALTTPAPSHDGMSKVRPPLPVPEKRHPMHTCMDLATPPAVPPPLERDWITFHDPQWPTGHWFWKKHMTLIVEDDLQVRNALGMIWGYSSRLLNELDRLHRAGQYGFSEVFVPTIVQTAPHLHAHTAIVNPACYHYTCCEFMSVAFTHYQRWSQTEPKHVAALNLTNCLLHPVKHSAGEYKHEIDSSVLLPQLPRPVAALA